MCRASDCQKDINENALVPCSLTLKETLKSNFEERYRPGKKITWTPFRQDWAREIVNYRCPTNPTVKDVLYKKNRRAFTYSVADGLCRLLLNCCYPESISLYPAFSDSREFTDLSEQSNHKGLSKSYNVVSYENISMLRLPNVIGREDAIETLLQWLAEPDIYQIAITGLGGMGKTTLALAVARQCLEAWKENTPATEMKNATIAPKFDAVVFISARQRYLEEATISSALYRDRTLEDIVHAIAKTLDCFDLLQQPFNKQLPAIIEKLKQSSTLLILDDFESFESPDTVLALLNDRLHGFPNTVKTLVTGRGHIPIQQELRLSPLTEAAASTLLKTRAQQKRIRLSNSESLELTKQGCSVPGVILYAVGLLASGSSVDHVLSILRAASGELAAYLFETSIAPLRTQPAHRLLMALALFPKPAFQAALEAVAFEEVNPIEAENGLAKLQKLSLIERLQGQPGGSSGLRYIMLPLTRTYVVAGLQGYPELVSQMNNRWVKWYRDWTAAITTETDWRRWNQSPALVQDWDNVQAAIEWCVACEHYEAFWAIWRNVRGYTHFAGYWTDRLRWLEWFTQVARQRQDWPQIAEALYDKGRTLILQSAPEQLQQAKTLFQEAWMICEQYHPTFQGEISVDMAALFIYQSQFKAAWDWLDLTEHWLNQAAVDESIHSRLAVQVAYYRGETCFKTQKYEQAQQQYDTAMELAEEIGWQRALAYSQVWLADLAVERQAFQQAEMFLEQALPILEEYKDERCLARCRKSYALLEQARGNDQIRRMWARHALEGFQRLGMEQEVTEMEQLAEADT